MSTMMLCPRCEVTLESPANAVAPGLAVEGVVVVAVRGELDLAYRALLEQALTAATASARGVVVDLGGCSFMDCAGVHALQAGQEQARTRGASFAVAYPHGSAPDRVLELTVPGLLSTYTDRATALIAVVSAPAAQA